MIKLILTFVMVVTATSVSLAKCPFSNMASNSAVGRTDTTTVYNPRASFQQAPVGFAQPVEHSK